MPVYSRCCCCLRRPMSSMDFLAEAVGFNFLEENGCLVVDFLTPEEFPVRQLQCGGIYLRSIYVIPHQPYLHLSG